MRLSPEASANLWVKAAPETESKPWEQPRATLADLQVGEVGIVKGISPQCRGLQRRRLLDLGFVPGTRVVAELRSPSGDPTAYRVRNTLIALRRDQAQLIDIEPIHAGSSTTPLQPVQNRSP
ncbi:MAG: ferrous iron transport protein A [Clostridia bacterium]|nr:ferrous iron transport protein A [Clostridia bacterium]